MTRMWHLDETRKTFAVNIIALSVLVIIEINYFKTNV